MTLHAAWVVTGPRTASEAAAVALEAPADMRACVRELNAAPMIVLTSRIAWHRSPTHDMREASATVASAFARWNVSCGNELALEEIRHGEYTIEQAIADGEFVQVAPAA